MKCIECGKQVEKSKPCMKRQHPQGAPICDDCCKVCFSMKGLNGRRGECIHLENQLCDKR